MTIDHLSDTPEVDARIPIFFNVAGHQSFKVGPATLEKQLVEETVIGHNKSLFIEMGSEKRPNLGSSHLGKQMIDHSFLPESL